MRDNLSDRYVLLKIKREWSHDEAVKALQKIISDLQLEIGMLKSDLAEKIDTNEQVLFLVQENEKLQKVITTLKQANADLVLKAERIQTKGGKTKKAWFKDEIVGEINNEMLAHRRKSIESRKSMEEWRTKYLNLLAKTSKNDTTA